MIEGCVFLKNQSFFTLKKTIPPVAFRQVCLMKHAAAEIFRRFREFIRSRGLIGPGERLLLSLSAGKDSMALLHLIMRLRGEMGFEAAVFHLNHCVRGEESDDDEEFVKAAATVSGLPAFIERFDFSKRPPGRSFEEYARAKRYEMLSETASRNEFTAIATAHTASDNAETLLMRLFRGTGVHGLAGMDARRDRIIRPILFLSSAEIRAYLEAENIAWREDSSNLDTEFLRNFIRHELMPKTIERFPGAERAVVQLGEAAREQLSLLGDLVRENYGALYRMRGEEALIEHERFKGDGRLLKFALTQAVHECFGGYVTRRMLEQIEGGIGARRSHVLLYRNDSLSFRKTIAAGHGVIAISRTGTNDSAGTELWERGIELSELDKTGEVKILIETAGLSFLIRLVEYDHFLENRTRPDRIFIAVPEELHYIVLRNRRRGDRIRLGGGEKKVKELFIDGKLERHKKERIPLLCAQGRVAAVLGGLVSEGSNRIADDFLVHAGDKKILAISLIGS